MQKKLKVMFKNLKLIKIYKKIFLYVQERSKSLNVQKRSKNKVLGDHSCILMIFFFK